APTPPWSSPDSSSASSTPAGARAGRAPLGASASAIPWLCSKPRSLGHMAFDEALADRIRDVLAGRAEVSERKMFGGLAFMPGGPVAVGVIGEALLARLGPDGERALAEPHTRPMDFTGKPMKSTIFVEPEGTAGDADLTSWVEAGADFAASLEPK